MADGDIVIEINGVRVVEDSTERVIIPALLPAPKDATRYCAAGYVVKIHPTNVQHWRDAGYLPAAVTAAADPWALPAGLEWCEETCMPGGSVGMWAVRSIDRTTAVADLGDTYELVALIRRRDTEDPYPGKAAATTPEFSFVVETCADCQGSRVYVGLGFFPAEMCRTCYGTGKIRRYTEVAPPRFDPDNAYEVVPDPWALPAEANVEWRHYVGAGWTVVREPLSGSGRYFRDIALYENAGAMVGPAGDLSPELQLALFDLIQRRNKAEPNGPPP